MVCNDTISSIQSHLLLSLLRISEIFIWILLLNLMLIYGYPSAEERREGKWVADGSESVWDVKGRFNHSFKRIIIFSEASFQVPSEIRTFTPPGHVCYSIVFWCYWFLAVPRHFMLSLCQCQNNMFIFPSFSPRRPQQPHFKVISISIINL